MLSIFGFDPKITQTLTEIRKDQDSLEENEMVMKEIVFSLPYFFIHKGNREPSSYLSHTKHSAAKAAVAVQILVFHHHWVPLFDEGVI